MTASTTIAPDQFENKEYCCNHVAATQHGVNKEHGCNWVNGT